MVKGGPLCLPFHSILLAVHVRGHWKVWFAERRLDGPEEDYPLQSVLRRGLRPRAV